MFPLPLLIIAGLALFLPDAKNEPNKPNLKEENTHDDLRQTSRNHRARRRDHLSRSTSPERGSRSVKQPSNHSVVELGEESATNEQEGFNHASRQTSTQTNDSDLQLRESGLDTTESGHAISSTETTTEGPTDGNGSE